jgi:carbonic anhydrase/acetyltransferase-like protein (isoleucine patch superfamily)
MPFYIIMDFLNELRAKVKKGKDVFIAPNATVLGDVDIGNEVSVWFGAVIRADTDKISIGDRSNIQDNAVLHVDPGVPVKIGNEVIVGHSAIIHGAAIADNTLIGMHSVILNHAQIGSWCIIGANSLVTEGTIIPDFSIVMGSPARVVKILPPERTEKIRKNAEAYVKLAQRYLGK